MEKEVLTVEKLNEIGSQIQVMRGQNRIFVSGEAIFEEREPQEDFTDEIIIAERVWTAVLGAIGDWAIYVERTENIPRFGDRIATTAGFGRKLRDVSIIRKLVPCTDEVFARYRF